VYYKLVRRGSPTRACFSEVLQKSRCTSSAITTTDVRCSRLLIAHPLRHLVQSPAAIGGDELEAHRVVVSSLYDVSGGGRRIGRAHRPTLRAQTRVRRRFAPLHDSAKVRQPFELLWRTLVTKQPVQVGSRRSANLRRPIVHLRTEPRRQQLPQRLP